MVKLARYNRTLNTTYAPGVFSALELLHRRPEAICGLLVHSAGIRNTGVDKLIAGCAALGIAHEINDREVEKHSGKENCFAVAVVVKYPCALNPAQNHVVLHNPSDMGNLGTILRTCLGFGVQDIAIIRPAADFWDPRVARASMGAVYGLSVVEYDHMDDYRASFPKHQLLPFMLQASVPLATIRPTPPFSLVFGNESRGLPEDYAALGTPVRIPHGGDIDSLNLAVAAGIGIYTLFHKE